MAAHSAVVVAALAGGRVPPRVRCGRHGPWRLPQHLRDVDRGTGRAGGVRPTQPAVTFADREHLADDLAEIGVQLVLSLRSRVLRRHRRLAD